MPNHRSIHILIVDSNRSAAHVTSAIMARAAPDARLTVVPEAERAVRMLGFIRPDILVIDPSPSPATAIRVIAAAKAQQFAARVVVLASAPTAGLRRQMLALGVDLYLEKPSPLLVADLLPLFEGVRKAS